ARKNGSSQKTKKQPRPVRTVRRDGREPMGLGAAIGALVTERAWELPAAGATLRERRAAIAPELAGHVAAIAFDADSGRLTVHPESAAWPPTRRRAARLFRTLRILPPRALPAAEPSDAEPAAAATPSGPVRTRETASGGYRHALAAHQT